MNKRVLLYCILLAMLLSGCQSVDNKQVNSKQEIEIPENYKVEVRGLKLKYVLIDSAYEIYQFQTEFKDLGSQYLEDADDRAHYEWMEATYKEMSEEMKQAMEMVFTKTHPWPLLNATSALSDEASVEEIIECILANKEAPYNTEEKEQFTYFFAHYYEDYLKDYLKVNEPIFKEKAQALNDEINGYSSDILTFMEEKSGISFIEKKKPVFYFTLRKIGAMGFDMPNEKVSLIQRDADMTNLFDTPFHEYGHELFRTFTSKETFKEVTNALEEKDRNFRAEWEARYASDYNWVGWCEENLVEGFAKYLSETYYEQEINYSSYVYDGQFYDYLKEIQFDSQEMSLEEVCLQFYEEILKELD